MQIWFAVMAVFVFSILMLALLANFGWTRNRQKRQGFARRTSHYVLAPTHFTRKKPKWVMLEVLRLKSLMGKTAGCRKVADTFNRLHARSNSPRPWPPLTPQTAHV